MSDAVGTRSFEDLIGGFPTITTTEPHEEVHGTTVIAVRFDQGCIVLADRRATMGNLIMYDHAEKVFALDDSTVVAISGAYARSLEVCRYLKHSFKFYERLNLVRLSTEGKLMTISRALANNLPMAAQGIGIFLPIAATYDERHDLFAVHAFDGAGARFQHADYAAAGSGSERIRGLFEYLIRREGPWASRRREDVLRDGLTLLDIAADLDSATGGFQKVRPSVMVLTREGIEVVPDSVIEAMVPGILHPQG
jgi:proteasome beta subunit